MYDYDADDTDEVSFRDGDVIVDCKPVSDLIRLNHRPISPSQKAKRSRKLDGMNASGHVD